MAITSHTLDFAGRPAELVLALDVTERLVAERAFRESEQRFRAVVQNAQPVIFILDRDGRFRLSEGRALAKLGLAPGEVVGRSAFDMYEDVPSVLDSIRKALDGRLARVENRVGNLVFDTVYSPFHDSDGRLDGVIGIAVDITDRKRAEDDLQRLNEELEARVQERTRALEQTLEELRSAQQELVRTEKLASLGSLVAGVAHELNTPIGNCVTVASTLSDRTAEFQRQIGEGTLRRSALEGFLDAAGASADMLLRNALRAATLVQSFKQVAVDQTSELRRRFDLRETVAEIIATMTPALKGTAVSFDLRVPDGIELDSFPGPFGQVLINLIRNALVHGFDDHGTGQIRIAASTSDENWLELTFADDGKGIPAEHLDRIFDPFFTTRLGQGGSGLGLHIVHNLVTGPLGGRIAVQSVPGEGAEFRIRLPRVAPQRVPGNEPEHV